MSNSLYDICNQIFETKAKDYIIGNDIIKIESYYDAEKIIINDASSPYGSQIEDNIVLLKSPIIEVNSILTVLKPKKSLVLFCDILINNNTISMTGKGPYTKPHDFHIIYEKDEIFSFDVIIPAYANNQVGPLTKSVTAKGLNGNNGTNRQCGSGGTGSINSNNGGGAKYVGASGMGYAFGGGAGSGGETGTASNSIHNVDTTYPMIGGHGYSYTYYYANGGVGNPCGNETNKNSFWNYTGHSYTVPQNIGVGGRIIIFCNSFKNNGTIEANGISCSSMSVWGGASGGASGGGAIDIFTRKIEKQGILQCNGGSGISITIDDHGEQRRSGNGGNGCFTISFLNFDIDLKDKKKNDSLLPSLRNTNIYKDPQNHHLFDLSYLGVIDRPIDTIIKQENHYFQIGDVLYYNIKEYKFYGALAKNTIESEVVGLVSDIIDKDHFELINTGFLKTERYQFNIGTILYLSDVRAGKLVSIASTNVIKIIGTQQNGGILIDFQRGYVNPETIYESEEYESYTKEELDEIIENIW